MGLTARSHWSSLATHTPPTVLHIAQFCSVDSARAGETHLCQRHTLLPLHLRQVRLMPLVQNQAKLGKQTCTTRPGRLGGRVTCHPLRLHVACTRVHLRPILHLHPRYRKGESGVKGKRLCCTINPLCCGAASRNGRSIINLD